ncbi:MAG TPA: carboxylesterase [Lapillicoccus sp.]|nr:carboxylesterase [Lapillicoccus sp.]
MVPVADVAAILDVTAGATLHLPDSGDRYLSVMVGNQDHYLNAVHHDAGEHRLTLAAFETSHLLVAARILVDPYDAEDVSAVNALQDEPRLDAASATPFEMPNYDVASYTATRQAAVLALAKGVEGFARAFGRREDVDPFRHLLGTAAGWGGLPDHEAYYLNVEPTLPVGAYQLTVCDVPVDGLWSVSLYTPEGYFPTDTGGKVSVNALTAERNADESVTIHFGGPDDAPNQLPIMDGWIYLVPFCRPRPEILDGTWTFPTVEPA